ncbi:hypothetical protein AX774_g1967 [Zancudomyces culisetae]|uniref:Uncharacterized protein n=1 Tax=Zancudomyces culisetae TaxID=1213189 RepID=A0A1R1PU73_ZANCU|nr:hypothetical protein AX774_g1967 [Zancudomyces culisetae]|eukprot:OMH84508.1 hypothetical protein AX774_g1967 [Zancudomyces culisetae]
MGVALRREFPVVLKLKSNAGVVVQYSRREYGNTASEKGIDRINGSDPEPKEIKDEAFYIITVLNKCKSKSKKRSSDKHDFTCSSSLGIKLNEEDSGKCDRNNVRGMKRQSGTGGTPLAWKAVRR